MSLSLPTSRQLLTSLLNAISEIPIPDKDQQEEDSLGQRKTLPNPLRLINAEHRPLFTTLHVLFPSLLLPALDLLDRGLVSRLTLRRRSDSRHFQNQDEGGNPAKDHDMISGNQGGRDEETEAAATVYIVRSAQPLRRHFGANSSTTAGGPSSSGQAYIVHINAWNCTCAAFAFAAFPGQPLQREPEAETKVKDDDEMVLNPAPVPPSNHEYGQRPEADVDSTPWHFGGMSFDGIKREDGAGGIPCCKHLLACVLAERWAGALGQYVTERTVGKEEMAGIVADI